MTENSSDQKKVCHVTSAHPRYDVRIFHKECKSLTNYGFDVTLLVNDNLPNESIYGVKIVSTQLKPKNRYDRMIKSKKKIRKLMLEIDADIYHFHDPELLPEAGWIKNKGKMVIFDFHEDVTQQILFKMWIPQKIRKIVSTVYNKYEKHNVRKFDGLISVTPKFVDRLKQINPNTIMVTNYPIISKDNNANKDIPKKKAICFAGGISPQWNHENIIKAIESIEDIEYILAGSGSKEYLEKLQSLEGWRKVRYLGRIPHDEVRTIYNESMAGMTLLCHNTQVGDEGTLGNTKIFEFMEAGLPIICSNNKLWKSIATKNECGIFVDSENIYEITMAITKIISDNKLSFLMGENGRKAVANEFNWRIQEQILVKSYLELLN